MIQSCVIDFGNEHDVREFFFHLVDGPAPKLHRHHVRHVATEGVDTLACPEFQYVQHLVPGRWNGVEVAAVAPWVDAVVEFHGLVPVVDAWVLAVAVVTGCFSRMLAILFPVVA